jgi:hypothetical protein
VAGSVPSIRVTLSDTPAANTSVSLTSSGSALTVPATVLVPAGSRYGTVVVTCSGVDTDTPVFVTATLNSVATVSPTVTVQHATLDHMTYNVKLSPNHWVDNQTVPIKITLTGPAGPSGYLVTISDGFLFPLVGKPFQVLVPAGQSIVQTSFTSANYGKAFEQGTTTTTGQDSVSSSTNWSINLPL